VGDALFTTTDYYVLSAVWASEVWKGYNVANVNKVLLARGILSLGTEGKAARSERLPGMGKTRCYLVSAAALNADESGGGGWLRWLEGWKAAGVGRRLSLSAAHSTASCRSPSALTAPSEHLSTIDKTRCYAVKLQALLTNTTAATVAGRLVRTAQCKESLNARCLLL
jgi:hypothetical protein